MQTFLDSNLNTECFSNKLSRYDTLTNEHMFCILILRTYIRFGGTRNG